MPATLAEIQALADSLQVSLDQEQQQIADLLAQKQATIDQLNATITELQGLVADGGTTEQRQALLDQLTATKADLESTVAP
ncbi:hypothetical protein [Mycoplasmopsis arginini]|uniref:Uncharacterized protein n=1 Tax=Mycoplasmopsis arginini TaxID=2094 RepID=A0AA43QWZ0_MYCAR|nr:hypothetical protein [Mycoplasmopsis arginini]MDI3349712.1 hypothetical protein [Mycoplasmopsis arginini]